MRRAKKIENTKKKKKGKQGQQRQRGKKAESQARDGKELRPPLLGAGVGTMAAVSSTQRDSQQRFAALSIGVNGGSDGGMSKATTLPSSPLARRGVGLAASTLGNSYDKEPLLPMSYKGASSGDLHGHYKRVTSQRANSLGMSRSFVAGSAYCMGEFFLFFPVPQEGRALSKIHCSFAPSMLS